MPSAAKAGFFLDVFGTTEQLAERLDFLKSAKNGSRQDDPGTIGEPWLMVLHLQNLAHSPSIRSFSANCEVVPKGAGKTRALAPVALFPFQFGFGQRSAAQPARRTLSSQQSIKLLIFSSVVVQQWSHCVGVTVVLPEVIIRRTSLV